ncbi:MAG: NAD(P)/FAD-dependent oxidoreductase [Salibacteraceae bacterium]|nr:NAD(P)/FAD-dependent oxidoreductase [Salibacteraceae bacterium]|tara:strand:- start:19818 stop:20942 length:1125 start_codon:yes stop_codon:yes gene_type:complete
MGFDIIVIGGGLGGLCSTLHLSKKGLKVLLIEKHEYPKHKVCGEYISNEVLPYLNALGFDPFDFGAKAISDFTLSTPGSRSVKTKLPLGGFSISRYCLDWELAKKAQAAGAEIVHASVTDIQFENDRFRVLTKDEEFTAPLAIGSFGKRSNLDVKLDRDFIKKPSPFLGVKAHYKGNFPENAVGLHNFEGGYCGISKVENDNINICYLADFKSFKQYKNIDDFQEQVLSKNTFLKEILDNAKLAFEKPLTISQVSFERKHPVENHMIMCGDSAGMIHPLAGNGMSMAIKAAQVASLLILKFKSGKINSRLELEKDYLKAWNSEFSGRLRSSHVISRLFRLGLFSELLIIGLNFIPFILPTIITKTHGKSMSSEL